MPLKGIKLEHTATRLLNQSSQFDRLREIANRKSYSYKIQEIHIKVTEQFEFWNRKQNLEVLANSTQKLVDLKKDLSFIESQINNSNPNKERIDILAEKYDISYVKSNRTSH